MRCMWAIVRSCRRGLAGSSFTGTLVLLFRLGATPPPRCLRACKYAYSHCVLSSFLRSCLLLLFFFSPLPCLFRFRFGRRSFHPVGILIMLSHRFRFRLRLQPKRRTTYLEQNPSCPALYGVIRANIEYFCTATRMDAHVSTFDFLYFFIFFFLRRMGKNKA